MATIAVRAAFTMELTLGEMYCIKRAVERYRDYLHGEGEDPGEPPGGALSNNLLAVVEAALEEATRSA